MKHIFFALLAVLTIRAQSAKAAGEDPAARLFVTCVACHGGNGISANPLWPNLAGQKAEYLSKQIHDFQQGRRNDPLMTPIAKTLSENDVAELVRFISAMGLGKG